MTVVRIQAYVIRKSRVIGYISLRLILRIYLERKLCARWALWLKLTLIYEIRVLEIWAQNSNFVLVIGVECSIGRDKVLIDYKVADYRAVLDKWVARVEGLWAVNEANLLRELKQRSGISGMLVEISAKGGCKDETLRYENCQYILI